MSFDDVPILLYVVHILKSSPDFVERKKPKESLHESLQRSLETFSSCSTSGRVSSPTPSSPCIKMMLPFHTASWHWLRQEKKSQGYFFGAAAKSHTHFFGLLLSAFARTERERERGRGSPSPQHLSTVGWSGRASEREEEPSVVLLPPPSPCPRRRRGLPLSPNSSKAGSSLSLSLSLGLCECVCRRRRKRPLKCAM